LVWDKAAQAAVIGRFGWKANQPNLRQQNADAAPGDLGLTTALDAQQNCTGAYGGCLAAIPAASPS
jgi:CxxC motif-containing protein (DUF1111 family)